MTKLSSFNANRVQLNLIVHDHWKLCFPANQWRDHRSDKWVVNYCGWEGMRCKVTVPGSKTIAFPRAPGTWHIHAPHVRFEELYPCTGEWHEFFNLYFTITEKFTPYSFPPFAVITDPEDRIAPQVRSMNAIQQQGHPFSDLITHGMLCVVLGQFLMAASHGNAGTAEDPWVIQNPDCMVLPKAGLLQRVDHLCSKNLSMPPSIGQLASALNMSTSSLSHKYKQETGTTLVGRMHWLRIREARKRLNAPGATIKAVALDLGFCNPFYFSKIFTQVTGITPVSYLRRVKIKNRFISREEWVTRNHP